MKLPCDLHCFIIGAGNEDDDASNDIDVSSLVSDCGSEGIVVFSRRRYFKYSSADKKICRKLDPFWCQIFL